MPTTITAEQLEYFKQQNPHNTGLQQVTLDQVLENTSGKVDWDSIPSKEPLTETAAAEAFGLTDCQLKIGWVVVDIVCIAVGAIGLRKSMSASTAARAAEAVGPVVSKIELIIADMSAPGASLTTRAWGVFKILNEIRKGGCLSAVIAAFTDSLSWWDMILYGVTGMATIVAALATDGAAFAAEVVIVLATFGFLASDIANAVQSCSITPAPAPAPEPVPQPTPDPFPFEPKIAMRTYTGNALTIVENGGLNDPNVPIQTDRRVVGPWEKFTVVSIDEGNRTFALKTCNGNFLTAVNGGGLGGPNDSSSPVHTDATLLGPWEELTLVQQSDGTYAICTTSGYYLTATNGGGWGEAANQYPIHTDASVLGGWETFTAVDFSNAAVAP